MQVIHAKIMMIVLEITTVVLLTLRDYSGKCVHPLKDKELLANLIKNAKIIWSAPRISLIQKVRPAKSAGAYHLEVKLQIQGYARLRSQQHLPIFAVILRMYIRDQHLQILHIIYAI